jgi:hypothetical protein
MASDILNRYQIDKQVLAPEMDRMMRHFHSKAKLYKVTGREIQGHGIRISSSRSLTYRQLQMISFCMSYVFGAGAWTGEQGLIRRDDTAVSDQQCTSDALLVAGTSCH